MLTVTDKAADAVRKMTNTEVYPAAGIRIRSLDGDRYAIAVVPGPAAADVMVDASGAHVYLDHDAAEELQSATLDAADDTQRTEQFSLTRG